MIELIIEKDKLYFPKEEPSNNVQPSVSCFLQKIIPIKIPFDFITFVLDILHLVCLKICFLLYSKILMLNLCIIMFANTIEFLFV